jgi:DNA primase
MPDKERVDFELLKNAADFRTVLTHYGLTPSGSGAQARLLCPFHDDARPSCSVNLSKRVFHCFSCGAAGNVLDFVHRMEGLFAGGGEIPP